MARPKSGPLFFGETMELDVMEQLEGLDVSTISKARARELMESLIMYYISEYRPPGVGKTRAGLGMEATAGMIRERHADLLDRLELSSFNGHWVTAAYNRVLKRVWSEPKRAARDLAHRNLQRQERAMEIIEGIWDSEDPKDGKDIKLAAIDRFVAVEKRQAAIAGYDAPQKISLAAESEGNVFTEEQKKKAVEELREWEKEQFGLPDTASVPGKYEFEVEQNEEAGGET
jgi:hypothetical protein